MFEILATDTIDLDGPDTLLRLDLMSPFVWRAPNGQLAVLLRAVPRPFHSGDCTGTIWLGRCEADGRRFVMDHDPLIIPGPGPLDIRGCEDPTVVPTGTDCVVYYTGLDEDGNGQMLFAEGPDVRALEKKGIALASSKTERNTKEASVDRTKDGNWRLFYEYSRGGRSCIGLAHGRPPDGPWDEQADPFEARPDCWDSWHLSTGPLLMSDPDAPVMFYNGSDSDARWGIGWVVFDRNCSTVVARSEEPLIAPPPDATVGRDISFAASVLQTESDIWLYFSRNDRRILRARIRRSTAATHG